MAVPNMLDAELDDLLGSKDEAARSEIARRVGQRLLIDDLSDANRRAAEALARELAHDAIERVRCELSKAIRHSKFLPRDIALKIAHDVDSVACPFLEVTDVFSESDWQQLILTISRGALIAVANRSSMNEGLALALNDLGDSVVAETLIENSATPMTEPVCHTFMDRFGSDTWILDKLAHRDDLIVEIVVKLTEKVSAAAREKLLRSYRMPDHTEPIMAEADTATILSLIRDAPEARLPTLAESLKQENKLTHHLLLAAARKNLLAFFGAALSALAAVRLDQVNSVILHSGTKAVIKLFEQARIPAAMYDDFWEALEVARSQREEPAGQDAG